MKIGVSQNSLERRCLHLHGMSSKLCKVIKCVLRQICEMTTCTLIGESI